MGKMSMESLIVRNAIPDDYHSIVAVVNSEVAQYSAVLTNEEMDELGIGKESYRELVEGSKTRNYLVAEYDGSIIGFCSWYLKDSQFAWVSMLNVLPDYQGRGVGRLLLATVEAQARKYGARAIALEVQKKAEWAVNFYTKMGFRPLLESDFRAGTFTGLFSGSIAEPTLVMGKEL
jgi:GNAT superfamily N-acetyltransferase